MPKVRKISGIEPVPRYTNPDTSVPDSYKILDQLQEYPRSLIGSSYYYVRMENDLIFLCRLIPSTGKLFFHEIVDHNKLGISDDDLEESINLDEGSFSTSGYYLISPHIETKLRVLMDNP